MSALSVLYLILPFPIAFIVHEAEEIGTFRRWLSSKGEGVKARLPKSAAVIDRLSSLDKAAFSVAALEELLLIILITLYLLSDLPYASEIWYTVFLAFALHLFIHIAQAIIVRGYVPGLVSAIILIPYICMGLSSISLVMPVYEMVILAVVGLALAAANLWLAQSLGQTVSGLFRRR